jgi:hypothetical protein
MSTISSTKYAPRHLTQNESQALPSSNCDERMQQVAPSTTQDSTKVEGKRPPPGFTAKCAEPDLQDPKGSQQIQQVALSTINTHPQNEFADQRATPQEVIHPHTYFMPPMHPQFMYPQFMHPHSYFMPPMHPQLMYPHPYFMQCMHPQAAIESQWGAFTHNPSRAAEHFDVLEIQTRFETPFAQDQIPSQQVDTSTIDKNPRYSDLHSHQMSRRTPEEPDSLKTIKPQKAEEDAPETASAPQLFEAFEDMGVRSRTTSAVDKAVPIEPPTQALADISIASILEWLEPFQADNLYNGDQDIQQCMLKNKAKLDNIAAALISVDARAWEPTQIGSIVKAFANAKYKHEALFHHISDVIQKKATENKDWITTFQVEDIANTLKGFADLNIEARMLLPLFINEILQSKVVSRLVFYDHKQNALGTIAWACACIDKELNTPECEKFVKECNTYILQHRITQTDVRPNLRNELIQVKIAYRHKISDEEQRFFTSRKKEYNSTSAFEHRVKASIDLRRKSSAFSGFQAPTQVLERCLHMPDFVKAGFDKFYVIEVDGIFHFNVNQTGTFELNGKTDLRNRIMTQDNCSVKSVSFQDVKVPGSKEWFNQEMLNARLKVIREEVDKEDSQVHDKK